MDEMKKEFVPDGNLALVKTTQGELFEHSEFTVEANLVKYSAVFPPHSPQTPLYSTKHIDAIPTSLGGGVITTMLTTSTAPFLVQGKTVMDRVPGDFEKKVFYAIVSIWVMNGKPQDGIVQFSIGKLLEQLGLNAGGKNYRVVKEAIARIARSTIKIEGSYVSAPELRKDTREFSLFASYQESVTRRGRKSAHGTDTDFYRVTLNTAIVNNMIHDYSIVIQVKEYTSALSKYYRRLVDIIEFEFQKGRGQEKEKMDFLLSQLAKNLPLEGHAHNVSTILKRLGPSLKELKDLGGYHYEVTKADTDAVFTVYSKSYVKKLHHKKTFQEAIDEYFAIHEKMFSSPFWKTTHEDKKVILDFLNADESEMDFEGEKVYKTIHLLDVFFFQEFVKGRKKKLTHTSTKFEGVGSIARLGRAVLNGAIVLKYPDGYKSYVTRLKEFEAVISKNALETEEGTRTKSAIAAVEKQAEVFYSELTASGRMYYVKRIMQDLKMVNFDPGNFQNERAITEYIRDDISNGSLNRVHFKALKPLTAVVLQNN